ncbi:MAG: ABC transporter permease [Pseudomonadota bacterium]
MNFFSQTFAITAMNLRNIPRRLGNSLVIVIGIAGAVGVFIPILAMSTSFRATIEGDANDARAIVLTHRATAESESSLSRQEIATIMDYPQVTRDSRGRPVASGEVILVAPVSRKRDHSDVNVTLRGVGEQYFAMRPELQLRSGRMFESGKQELVVGAGAVSQFDGLGIGENIRLQDGDWKVVGTFAGGNGARESEVVADALTVMSAYKLNYFNSLTVTLRSPRELAAFNDAVEHSSKSILVARGEPEYLATASESVNRVLRLVAYSIGSIMALGGLFSALNSMYSAVAARSVEMATLRALGFSALAVAFGVLFEALLLAFIGAAAGAAFAYLLFDGATISTLGGAVWDSQLVYSLSIPPALTIGAVLLACAVGLAGGLLPAIRAARANIAGALHET